MILCVKRRQFRRSYNKDTIKVTTDHHKINKECTNNECDNFSHHNEKVKLETINCLYEPTEIKTDDVTITPNPSYTVNPQTIKKPKYQYDYIQNSYLQLVGSTTTGEAHSNATDPASDDNIKIDFNSSYLNQDIILQDNPSYDKLYL